MSASSAGFSASGMEAVDAFLKARYIDAGRFPGTLTLVWRRGEIAHFRALGLADVERRVPMREDTVFRIYSMTKPLTTVAFMMLVEQGLVALDTPVHALIPEWKDLGVYQGGFLQTFRTTRPDRPMLVVDLLRHTSGLTYGFQQATNVDAAYRKLGIAEIRNEPLEEMIRKLATLPLEFSPGSAWNYSVATDVLGYLVGKLSGVPFPEFLRSRILEPLGMKDTDFHVRRGNEPRFAACYVATPGGGMKLEDDPAKSPYLNAPALFSGGGGLVGTAADYLRFCRMLLNRGSLDGVRLLGRKTVELMTTNHLPGGKDLPSLSRSMFSEVTYNGVGFGLGFGVTLDPARTLIPGSVGEFFWGGLASTAFFIDPAEDLIVIFMTQLMPSSTYPVRRELRTLIYSALS